MKKKFSKSWNGSKNPNKKRKYAANAPLHVKRKALSANLSKELRKKHGKRNFVLRKGDAVRVMRGKFKGKKGKVLEVRIKKKIVEIEGIQANKQDGSKVNVPINPSNLQITELHLEDKKRNKNLSTEKSVKSESSEKEKQTKRKEKENASQKKQSA